MATCPECAFDWERPPAALVEDLRGVADLQIPRSTIRIRTRPRPDVWSALEYAAHLRDVLRFYDDRIRRTLTEVRPQLSAFGFHDACERLGYNAEHPAEVLQQLHGQVRYWPTASPRSTPPNGHASRSGAKATSVPC